MKPFASFLAGLWAVVLLAAPARATDGALALKIVADVPITGGTTRLDLQSVDAERGLLYVAHPGSSMVHVMDIKTNRIVADIPDLPGVHGVLAVPELGKVFATVTKANQLAVIDARTFKVLARIATGEGPDALTYAPNVHAVFVSCKHGDSVIDGQTHQRFPDIDLGGEVANTRFDGVAKHIYANVQPLDRVVEIDPASRTIVATHQLPVGMNNHGMVVDEQRRLAYVAGAANSKIAVLDLVTWKVLAEYPVGVTPDVVAYDPARGVVFVASESGVVSEFRRMGHGLEKVGEGYAGTNAHTISVDPGSHRIFLPLRDVNGGAVLRVMEGGG